MRGAIGRLLVEWQYLPDNELGQPLTAAAKVGEGVAVVCAAGNRPKMVNPSRSRSRCEARRR